VELATESTNNNENWKQVLTHEITIKIKISDEFSENISIQAIFQI